MKAILEYLLISKTVMSIINFSNTRQMEGILNEISQVKELIESKINLSRTVDREKRASLPHRPRRLPPSSFSAEGCPGREQKIRRDRERPHHVRSLFVSGRKGRGHRWFVFLWRPAVVAEGRCCPSSCFRAGGLLWPLFLFSDGGLRSSRWALVPVPGCRRALFARPGTFPRPRTLPPAGDSSHG